MCLCMKSARYLLTYPDCCLFLFILFLSISILLHIFNAFILCKALWIVMYMKCATNKFDFDFDFEHTHAQGHTLVGIYTHLHWSGGQPFTAPGEHEGAVPCSLFTCVFRWPQPCYCYRTKELCTRISNQTTSCWWTMLSSHWRLNWLTLAWPTMCRSRDGARTSSHAFTGRQRTAWQSSDFRFDETTTTTCVASGLQKSSLDLPIRQPLTCGLLAALLQNCSLDVHYSLEAVNTTWSVLHLKL